MERYRLGEMEQRFADLIWQKEPVSTAELVRLGEAHFNWKRTTTYTMLKRLCLRGIFVNDGGIVRAVLTREEFQAASGEQFLEENFGGSLPRFLAAFTRGRGLRPEEAEELKRLIEEYEEGKDD